MLGFQGLIRVLMMHPSSPPFSKRKNRDARRVGQPQQLAQQPARAGPPVEPALFGEVEHGVRERLFVEPAHWRRCLPTEMGIRAQTHAAHILEECGYLPRKVIGSIWKPSLEGPALELSCSPPSMSASAALSAIRWNLERV